MSSSINPVTTSSVVPTTGKEHLVTNLSMYRIVKVWDKHTLSLQASLHSHEDVITDLDISQCNKYLVSSSKDGKIIVWDWKACTKIDEINDHKSTVNNIKFFTLKVKEDKRSVSGEI